MGGREKRWFLYYYRSAGSMLSTLEFGVVYLVIIVRTTCIYFRCGALLRQFFHGCGLGDKIILHQTWFQRASDMFDTDPFMWNVAVLFGNFVKSILVGFEETHQKVALASLLGIIGVVEFAVWAAQIQFGKKGMVGAGSKSFLKVHRNLGI